MKQIYTFTLIENCNFSCVYYYEHNRNRRFMPRIIPLLLVILIAVSLSACVKRSTLICDSCGKTFEGDADYSKQLEENEEIQSALNIRLYSFYCSDCRRDGESAIAAHLLSPEEVEILRAYREGKAESPSYNVDSTITIVEPTGMEPYYIAVENLSNLYGIYDTENANWALEPTLLFIDSYNSTAIAMAKRDNYYGYIDQTGNTVIGFQFSDAQSFDERGFAPVCMNKWGVINKEGNFIIEPIYEDISFLDNFINVFNGEWYGLYDFEGNQIIEAKYLEGFKFTPSRIYACVRIDSYGTWYKIYDYDGNSLMDTLPWSNALYVSYPYNGMHKVCHSYNDPLSDARPYLLCDEEFQLLYTDHNESCALISDFSTFGYAVVIPAKAGGSYRFEVIGLFVIDYTGTQICQLPDLPNYASYRGNAQYYLEYEYYVNQYFAIAKNNGGDGSYLINLQTLECSEWKRIVPLEGTNYICVQDENTELWSLYDKDEVVDNNCTNITYNGETFHLIHGGETTTYTPAN